MVKGACFGQGDLLSAAGKNIVFAIDGRPKVETGSVNQQGFGEKFSGETESLIIKLAIFPVARQKQVSAKISAGETLFSATGMTIEFPGFLRAYVEGSDDPEAELLEREVRLPGLKAKETLKAGALEPTDHETKPPARFTEASLVQTMEKEGIGRPSTYASIIGTIIDRGYVRKNAAALVPTFTALVVARLLSKHLPQFVDIGFTSGMEKSLDGIADGELDSEKYLEQIYHGKTGLKAQVENQEKKIDPDEARSIHLPGMDAFVFRVGKYGAYVCTKRDGAEVCASLPESECPADITAETADKLIDLKINGADELGKDPNTGLPIYALTGRYGPYVQLGDVTEASDKPKRVSIPPAIQLENITLAEALELLSLPKTLGIHPGTGKEVKAGLGRFGPFVVCDGDYRSIPKTESLFTITFERAMEMLSQPKKGRGRAAPLRELGPHPVSTEPIQVMNGPYGPYLKSGKTNVSLLEGMTVESVTLEEAVKLIDEKAGPAKAKKVKPATKSKETTKEKISTKLAKEKSSTKEKAEVTPKKEKNLSAKKTEKTETKPKVANTKKTKSKMEVITLPPPPNKNSKAKLKRASAN